MRYGFQRKQIIARVPALVLVVLLFCVAVFVAIHQGAR
jgi:succinate dehydrogenase hydrophobic anchor subunit